MKTLIIIIIIALVLIGGYFLLTSPSEENNIKNRGLQLFDSVTNNTNSNQPIIQEPEQTDVNDDESEEDDKQEDEEKIEEVVEPGSKQNIKIANFNAQIFGDSKWDKLGGDFYVNLIDDYDIFFLQEIRDADGSSFDSLCSLLDDYDCRVSSRAGRSSSKEQVGVIYKEGIDLIDFTDLNPDSQDRWERPPIRVSFRIDDYEIMIYNIHVKPDDVESEMDYLEEVVKTNRNVMVLGDLNLDCSYDDGSAGDFEDWNYLINDNEDTTVSQTDCAYDRIIVNDDLNEEVVESGIYTEIISEQSDHYLVWIEIGV